MTGSFANLEDAFRAYQADPVERLRVRVRRFRAREIVALAANPENVSLDQFNRDVWALETVTRLDGTEIKKGRLIDASGGLTPAEVTVFERAMDDGRLELHGNYIWKPGSGVYSPGGAEDVRLSNARAALRLIADPTLGPAWKAREIDELPGFGNCSATGLAMLAHPDQYAIFNGPSVAAMQALGQRTGDIEEFQTSARHLKERLNAKDFIELDWFLYLLSQKSITIDGGSVVPSGTPSDDPEYWIIAPGEGGRLWKEFREQGIIAIGWDALGDFADYASKEAIVDRLATLRNPGDPLPKNDGLACHEFHQVMKPGDVVFSKKGTREVLGIGYVTGDYEHRPERKEYKHVRRVRWVADGPWTVPEGSRPPTKTLTNVTEYDRFLSFGKPLLPAANTDHPSPLPPAPPTTAESTYGIDQALDGVFLSRDQFQAILDGLTRKMNTILQGPPGVGKTYLARRLAYCVAGAADPSRVQLVQFHQSYSYEDFVQGWRPAASGFARRDGVFFHFCKRAKADPRSNYVFVVDEINRGNLSKVFGELFLLIEADKRGPDYAIPLTYATDPSETFFVPDNVYLIGLMNTADRSLAMVDFALRRRFAFAELRPGFGRPGFRSLLLDRGADPDLADRIVDRMTKLNERIRAETAGLGAGFEVGHSFFCPQGTEDTLDVGWYRAVVEGEVAPLLREYWFDDPKKAEAYIAELLA